MNAFCYKFMSVNHSLLDDEGWEQESSSNQPGATKNTEMVRLFLVPAMQVFRKKGP